MRYDSLLERLAVALADGTVTERDVERLLARALRRPASTRPGAADVLRAIGVLVAYAGLGLLLALEWSGLHQAARTVSPFAFPAVALAAGVILHRARRPDWESELAGLVGFASLGLAFLAAADALNPSNVSLYAVVAGTIGAAAVLAVHAALRNVRLTGWGLSIALVTMTGGAAGWAGVDDDRAGWVVLPQSLTAGAAGWLLFHRWRDAAAAAIRTGLLLAYAAALIGQPEAGWDHLTIWHLVISVAVAAAFLLSAILDLDGLVWIGVLGALIWLSMVAAVVGSSAGWAISLVAAGAALVGLSLLVAALRRRRTAIG
jgi:hypothetical protein